MQFFTAALALAIAGFASAAPITTSNSTSCPGPVDPNPNPITSGIIRPESTAQYDVWTGAVRRNVNGKIFKDGKTTDVTTLLTFYFPTSSAGMTCSFEFDLAGDATAKVSGTGQFDVYTSLAPATRDATTWPSGNLRDHHIGRMTAKLGGSATWVPGFPAFGQGFPCPAGETYGGELVGQGDVDIIEWLAGPSGPYIRYQ